MPALGERIVDKAPPSDGVVREWLGQNGYSHWQTLRDWIDKNHPEVFQSDWVFGGAKHGWSLRYKKSKSFCTLVPEFRRMSVVIVFGAKEREKVAAILHEFPPVLRRLYEAAETYHDGKWLKLSVPTDATVADISKLLTVKRRPKPLMTIHPHEHAAP